MNKKKRYRCRFLIDYLSSRGIYGALGEIFWYAGHCASIFEGGGPQRRSFGLRKTIKAVEGVLSVENLFYLSSRGIYGALGEMFWYAGRIILPFKSSSSIRWALQPAIRDIAKIGVNSSRGSPSIL